MVVTGKDKGTTGKVVNAFPENNKVIVEGVNMVKKHISYKGKDKQGEVVEIAMPIDVSNVMILDPKDKKPTRVGYVIEDKKKVRIAKRSGQKI